MTKQDVQGWFAGHANIRTESYAILARLLNRPPSEDIVTILRNLEWDESVPEKMNHALTRLREAVANHSLTAMEEEFDRLFIGLGCGEMVPYASWYKERMIQAASLAALRSDLMRLGIVRQVGNRDSEDHAGALCETMVLLSQDNNVVPGATQAAFFREHMAPWMPVFFQDLKSAPGAEFYRAVGLFGGSFLEAEDIYLKYTVDNS
ncbi:MAG: molecular chaperone TorD family protein [Syntrophales bacterium]|nr:molecular chaperone TorD family protein [Syntrophales bacterium]